MNQSIISKKNLSTDFISVNYTSKMERACRQKRGKRGPYLQYLNPRLNFLESYVKVPKSTVHNRRRREKQKSVSKLLLRLKIIYIDVSQSGTKSAYSRYFIFVL